MAEVLNNPYNLRGALITPSGSDSSHYYLILIDVDPSSIINADSFQFTNPEETGDTLTYSFTNGNLVLPTQGGVVNTAMLPVYTNQNITKPDKEGDNIFVTLQVGIDIISSGQANNIHPPIVEAMERIPPLKCSYGLFQSLTSSGFYFILVLVNTNVCLAINPLILTPHLIAGSEPARYNLIGTFTPTENFNQIVAVGGLPATFEIYSNVWADGIDPQNGNGIIGPEVPIDWNDIYSL